MKKLFLALALAAASVFADDGVATNSLGALRSRDTVVTAVNPSAILARWAGGSLFLPGGGTNWIVRWSILSEALAGKQDALLPAQTNALNSGVTSAKVGEWDALKSSKQDALTEAQTNAINSGVTSAKVSAWDAMRTNKEDRLTGGKLDAVNSGITAGRVQKYESWGAGKQDALTEPQTNAVNSGVTAAKVAAYDALQPRVALLDAAKAGRDEVYGKAEIENIVIANLARAALSQRLWDVTWDPGLSVMWKKTAMSGTFFETAYTNVEISVTGGEP